MGRACKSPALFMQYGSTSMTLHLRKEFHHWKKKNLKPWRVGRHGVGIGGVLPPGAGPDHEGQRWWEQPSEMVQWPNLMTNTPSPECTWWKRRKLAESRPVTDFFKHSNWGSSLQSKGEDEQGLCLMTQEVVRAGQEQLQPQSRVF